MILHALYQLHDRLAEDPAYALAPEGYSVQKISFVVVLNTDGTLHDIQDLRISEGNTKKVRSYIVPDGDKPTGKITPKSAQSKTLFLRNDSSFLLGLEQTDSGLALTDVQFEAFRNKHLPLQSHIQSNEFSTVCRFLSSWKPSPSALTSKQAAAATGQGVFQIRNQLRFVHECPKVVAWWNSTISTTGGSAPMGHCMVTQDRAPLARLHEPKIKPVAGAQPSGAPMVAFDKGFTACCSFGLDRMQALNAPVSVVAASKYCKALNALLASDRHRIQIGDATTVFWTEQPTVVEQCLSAWLSGGATEDSAQDPERLGELEGALRAMQQGARPIDVLHDDAATPFYILGLTGQAGGRIGIRFWHRCTLGELFEMLALHHSHLAIERQWGDDSQNPDPEFPKLWQLLRQTAREAKDIPPTLGGALMRAVFSGGPYPDMLALAVINRIRADRTISYLRAAILKAWLTRAPNTKYGVHMSLNEQDLDVAYRLGRLFAALEKTQEDALGNINASIRDRFYSSASATPGSVFPRLLRVYQHHLAKLEGGLKVTREKLVQDIIDAVSEFPSFLDLQGQGRFAIGYYHQRKRLFTKKEATAELG